MNGSHSDEQLECWHERNLRQVREARLVRRPLARRTRLPNLLRPRSANTRHLPRMRPTASSSRGPPRRWSRNLRSLRGLRPVVRLLPLRLRRQPPGRSAQRSPGRRNWPHSPGAELSVRPARGNGEARQRAGLADDAPQPSRERGGAFATAGSRWLFPDREQVSPAAPTISPPLFSEIGRPAADARGAGIRQQLLEMPAPVVADALSYHDKSTARLLREGGGGWSRYAAGEHGQSR
jgi:hypothetical protein